MNMLSTVDTVASVIKTLIDRLLPDTEETKRKEIASELTMITTQLRINEAAARHPSRFVSGARPAFLWIGAIAVGMHYLGIMSLVEYITGVPLVIPDHSDLWPLIGALLGIGGMRSFEKSRGVARENMTHTPVGQGIVWEGRKG